MAVFHLILALAVTAVIPTSLAAFDLQSLFGMHTFSTSELGEQVPQSIIRDLESKSPFSPFLLRGSPFRYVSSSFSWRSCGPADQLMDVRNLTLKPSPLSFPGKLSFGFDIIFHDNIPKDANITAAVELQYSHDKSPWIKIPCLGVLGSCTYNDLCQVLANIECPRNFTKAGVPCKCPFNKGEYKLMDTVDVLSAVFVPGAYRSRAQLFMPPPIGQIGCYELNFSVI